MSNLCWVHFKRLREIIGISLHFSIHFVSETDCINAAVMNVLGAITCYASVGLNTPRIIPISCLESVHRNTHVVVIYSAHASTDTLVVVGSLFWYSCSFAVLFTLYNPVSSCFRKAKTEQPNIYQLTVQLMEVMEPLNGSQRELIGL